MTPTKISNILIATLLIPGAIAAQVSAFPGAAGFGKFATGGRGGKVINVRNLNDSGPGSFRSAIDERGPRTIVFRISGTIQLITPLVIRNGDLTIAGQTAPGDGICIRDRGVLVAADNVIIRFLRFRLGNSTHAVEDALSGEVDRRNIFRNILIDHCSMSWGIDECASFYDVTDFTMQWCFITESLDRSYHPKGAHGYASILGGLRSSFHHNLFAHHTSRNPRFNGVRESALRDSSLVDFRNNIIYNWGFNSAYGGEKGSQNVVANYYKYGPATKPGVRYRILEPSDSLGDWYVAENFVWNNEAITSDNWNGGIQGEFASAQKRKRRLVPFLFDSMETDTPQKAFELVLAHGGASLPTRDMVDERIVHEVKSGVATFGGSWGVSSGIIDSQDDAGGWPILRSTVPPADSDGDGIPDEWELDNGLSRLDPQDGAIIGGDGYSNLEHYLNSLASKGSENHATKAKRRMSSVKEEKQ